MIPKTATELINDEQSHEHPSVLASWENGALVVRSKGEYTPTPLMQVSFGQHWQLLAPDKKLRLMKALAELMSERT